MARPKKADEERRGGQLNLRVSASEQAELERFAAHYGLTVAEYTRRRALGHRLPPDVGGRRQTAAVATALMRIGVNVNQIAHRLNAGGRAPAYLEALIARIDAELDRLYDRGSDEKWPVF